MKQMLLNNNEHSVANIKNIRTKADAKHLYNYFNANDLNGFFNKLSANELSKFTTIQFNELIELRGMSFAKIGRGYTDRRLENAVKITQA